jgi:hypothetical protein
MWQVWEKVDFHTGFWWRDQRERDHLEDLGVVGRIMLKCAFKMWNGKEWIGLIWLRIGIGGGALVNAVIIKFGEILD